MKQFLESRWGFRLALTALIVGYGGGLFFVLSNQLTLANILLIIGAVAGVASMAMLFYRVMNSADNRFSRTSVFKLTANLGAAFGLLAIIRVGLTILRIMNPSVDQATFFLPELVIGAFALTVMLMQLKDIGEKKKDLSGTR